jgi:hypothetical protein
MYDFPTRPVVDRAAPAPEILGETEIRKAAACRAFWSDHPLNVAYREKVGSSVFTLSAFVEFVTEMSADDFAACMFSAGVLR